LTIRDRVVAKITGRAAGEVDGVEVRTAGGLRSLLGSTAPDVDADVDGTTASVNVTVVIDYPLPVFDTAAEIRRQVALRLAEYAGMDNVEIQVEIAGLAVGGRTTGPRVI
jgi:uncharacterized alkaline shock family protein YloU